MQHPYTFECPQCGASLSPHGDAVQVPCQYCGSMIVVPEDLRPKHADKPEAPSTAQLVQTLAELSRTREEERERPRKPESLKSRISSTIGSIVLIGAIMCICVA